MTSALLRLPKAHSRIDLKLALVNQDYVTSEKQKNIFLQT